MKKVRCAIYTRKSSENGLEQEFNSLDAQREACAAYIASQKHEGWVLLDNAYDDGGISGGTLDRRGLQKLMGDVEEGLVDQIVVYKIDRLTRSLADFAKLVEQLDKSNASFVSVTQSFNTATSMGRLTLNVLLSFAQFEREVTSERIRDKIAASKKKGLWMGGNVPLGYEADGRTLRINKREAETVKAVFELYKKHSSIDEVREEAERLNLKTRPMGNKHSTKGNSILSHSNIHYILTNPVYAGRIRHHNVVHDGQHPAIIDPVEWDEVQYRLSKDASRQRGRPNSATTASSLKGKVFDETGDRLTPSHTKKGYKRYRYYISNRLLGKKDGANPSPAGWRLSANLLEDQVARAVLQHFKLKLLKKLASSIPADEIVALTRSIDELDPNTDRPKILLCTYKVTLRPGQMQIKLHHDQTADLLGIAAVVVNGKCKPACLTRDLLNFDAPFQHRKRGVETKIILGDTPVEQDKTLIKNLAMAHHYLNEVKSGKHFDEIAADCKVSKRRIMQIINLAFLAPDIVQSIMQGKQPTDLTSNYLVRHPLPADWQQQRKTIKTL
ncbi:recombinase family protein [Maritalea porphyrae]|uniref:recombinase family protein n=1 Tax=Maritalea porphyrae TaxID=880732 RepID=UPI0022AEF3F5|nr:recombinase family protein [Maritalea porphyrae]MCZ4271305.1 recombinase family protein [Maritalea porphyrae]